MERTDHPECEAERELESSPAEPAVETEAEHQPCASSLPEHHGDPGASENTVVAAAPARSMPSIGEFVEVRDGDANWELGVVEAVEDDEGVLRPRVCKVGFDTAYLWDEWRTADQLADQPQTLSVGVVLEVRDGADAWERGVVVELEAEDGSVRPRVRKDFFETAYLWDEWRFPPPRAGEAPTAATSSGTEHSGDRTDCNIDTSADEAAAKQAKQAKQQEKERQRVTARAAAEARRREAEDAREAKRASREARFFSLFSRRRARKEEQQKEVASADAEFVDAPWGRRDSRVDVTLPDERGEHDDEEDRAQRGLPASNMASLFYSGARLESIESKEDEAAARARVKEKIKARREEHLSSEQAKRKAVFEAHVEASVTQAQEWGLPPQARPFESPRCEAVDEPPSADVGAIAHPPRRRSAASLQLASQQPTAKDNAIGLAVAVRKIRGRSKGPGGAGEFRPEGNGKAADGKAERSAADPPPLLARRLADKRRPSSGSLAPDTTGLKI